MSVSSSAIICLPSKCISSGYTTSCDIIQKGVSKFMEKLVHCIYGQLFAGSALQVFTKVYLSIVDQSLS
jgi:hypothetical protein